MSDYRTFHESDRPARAQPVRARYGLLVGQIVAAITAHGPMTAAEVRAYAIDGSESAIRAGLSRLATLGRLSRSVARATPQVVYRYGLPLGAPAARGRASAAATPDLPTAVWVHPIAAGTATALDAGRIEPLLMDYADPRWVMTRDTHALKGAGCR